MPGLKDDWQNGDLFTPAAANDMADAVNNAATIVTIDPTASPYGVKMDRYTTTLASMSSSTNPTHLTVTGYTFTSADVGKVVKVVGAATAGANLKTTITGVSSGKAVLASPCVTTVSGAFAMFGTDNATALATLFADLAYAGRERKLSRTAVFPIGVAMYSGKLTFPLRGTIKGVAENWSFDIMYDRFGGAENTGGTAFYQIWDQNVDCATVDHSGYLWFGKLEGFSVIQDWENTAGHGLNFTASDTTGIKINDGSVIDRVAAMGCANSGFNFNGGANGAITLKDLWAFANGYADRKVFTANTTSGSATLTSVSSTTGLAAGGIISGPGIPADAIISSVNAGASTVTLNQTATATASAVSVQRAGSAGIRFRIAAAMNTHFDSCAGDQNSGGLLRIVGPGDTSYGAPIIVSNMKAEFAENVYINGYHGPGTGLRPLDVPQQANAIVLDNLEISSVSIRGLVNWGATTSGVAAYDPPNTFGRPLGAAILNLNTAAAPTVSWESLRVHLPTGSTQDRVAYRDSLTPTTPILADNSGRGTNKPIALTEPTLTSPKIDVIVDPVNNGSALDIFGVASAANYLGVSNSATANAPQIFAAGTDANVSILAVPKGTGGVQISAGAGVTPRIQAIGADTDVSLNLQSKNAGTVNANGVPVVTTTDTQTLTNKSLTSPAITTPTGIVKGDVGLGNVDNTSNVTERAATATLTNKTISGASNTLSAIANESLTNSAITIAGTSTSLGGTITQDTITGLSATGLVKRTAANTLAAATVGTDYLAPADIENLGILTTGESTRPRALSTSGVSTGTGSLRLTYFTAAKTETINSIRTVCTTAGTSSTLQRIGIYSIDGSGNLTLVASTASDLTLWIATSAYTKTLSASFSKVRGTRYAVGILYVGGGTAPSLSGLLPTNATEAGQPPRLSGFLTSQTDLPATVAVGNILDTSNNHYAVLVP
jgi:hypothetical protein